MHYNPFAYLRSEKDILKLVQTIMANTKGEGEKSTEDFWCKAERLYYTALIGYLYYEAPEKVIQSSIKRKSLKNMQVRIIYPTSYILQRG